MNRRYILPDKAAFHKNNRQTLKYREHIGTKNEKMK